MQAGGYMVNAIEPEVQTPPSISNFKLEQDEDDAEDEQAWNPAMAAASCLGLVAKLCGDAVVPLVMPYVTANISKVSRVLCLTFKRRCVNSSALALFVSTRHAVHHCTHEIGERAVGCCSTVFKTAVDR